MLTYLRCIFASSLILIPILGYPQQAKIDSLTAALETATDTVQIDLMDQLTFAYWDFDIEKAYEYAKQTLIASEQMEYTKGMASALTNIGIYHVHNGDLEKALAAYRSALRVLGNSIYPRFPAYTLSRIANLYRHTGDFDSALYFYRSALQAETPPGSETVNSTIYYNMGIAFLEMEQLDSANTYIRRSLVIRKSMENPSLIAMSLSELGRLYTRLDDFDSATYFLDSAKAIAEQFNFPELQIVSAIYSGQLELRKGNFVQAIDIIKTSLELLNDYEYLELQKRSLFLLGSIYIEIGAYDGALENLLKAESLNRAMKNKKLAAEIDLETGFVYYYQNIPEKALQFAKQANRQFSELGLGRLEAASNNLLGLIELSNKNYAASEQYFDKGLVTYRALGYKKGLASILYNKSFIFLEQGELNQVLDIQLEALSYEKEINNVPGIIISYNSLGELYMLMGAYDQSEDYLIKAKDLLARHPSIAYEAQTFQYLAQLYGVRGDYKKAFEYLRMSKQNADSVFSLNSLNKSLELSAIHDLEKKELEIENLNREKAARNSELEIREQQVQLQRQIIYLASFAILVFILYSIFLVNNIAKLRRTQKELIKAEKRASLGILVAGLSHEINNPLNFIKGGVEVLKLNQNKWTENERQSMEVIDEGIARTSKILKLLSSFQQKNRKDYESCDLLQVINESLADLSDQIPENINVQVNNGNKQAITYGNPHDLKQLFTELIKNSSQSIKKSGEITINLSSRKKLCTVEIIDTGAGIDRGNIDLLENPFYTTKDPNIGKGMGLYLVDYILHEHEGTIRFDSSKGQGTITTITLPRSN